MIQNSEEHSIFQRVAGQLVISRQVILADTFMLLHIKCLSMESMRNLVFRFPLDQMQDLTKAPPRVDLPTTGAVPLVLKVDVGIMTTEMTVL